MIPTITVYGKPGCHLCEDALAVLTRVQAQIPFEIVEIDIRDNPEIFARYCEKIPVGLLGDQPLFEYSVAEGRLREALKEVNANARTREGTAPNPEAG